MGQNQNIEYLVSYNSANKDMHIKFSDKMQMSPKSGKVPSPEMVKSKNEKRPTTTMSASQNQMFRPQSNQKMS